MSYKENITPGEWKVVDCYDGLCIGMGSYLENSSTFYAKHRWDCADDDPDALGDPECEANAQLIAEAGTVCNETGKTPRELQQERDEALAALKQVKELADNGYIFLGALRYQDVERAIAKIEGDQT